MRDDALGEAHVPVRDIAGEPHEVSAGNLDGFTDGPGAESTAVYIRMDLSDAEIEAEFRGDLLRFYPELENQIDLVVVKRQPRVVS